jgi:uncharacterized membrane protein YphA (DoxX/SURF4 family)
LGVSFRMKAAFYGRIVFGASAVLFGVVSLIWHDSDMWQHLRAWGPPFAPVAAWGFAIALVAGGAAMLYPRTVRFASVVLGVVYGLFTLACISDMIAAPSSPGSYVDFFEQLSIVCGAVAVYVATETNAARSVTLGRVARMGLGVCAISFAWAQIAYLQYTASLVPTWIPPNQMFWTILTTVAFGLAAVAILINFQARLAMRLMALMMALFGVLVWLPQIVTHPGTLSNWNEFSSNYLMTAASWLVADVRAF